MTTNTTQKSTTKLDLNKAITAALDIVQSGKSHTAETDKFFKALKAKPIPDALNGVFDDLGTNEKVRKIARRAFRNSYRGWTLPTNAEPISTHNKVNFVLSLVITFLVLLLVGIVYGFLVAKLGHHLDPSGTGLGSATAIGWITFIGVLLLIVIAGLVAYGQYTKYKTGSKPATE